MWWVWNGVMKDDIMSTSSVLNGHACVSLSFLIALNEWARSLHLTSYLKYTTYLPGWEILDWLSSTSSQRIGKICISSLWYFAYWFCQVRPLLLLLLTCSLIYIAARCAFTTLSPSTVCTGHYLNQNILRKLEPTSATRPCSNSNGAVVDSV